MSRHRSPVSHGRRNTVIAVVLLLAGVLALAGMVYWQETRHDEYGREVGCALSQTQGLYGCDD